MKIEIRHQYQAIGVYDINEMSDKTLGKFVREVLKSNRDSYSSSNMLELKEIEEDTE